jgi:hypothetical protein
MRSTPERLGSEADLTICEISVDDCAEIVKLQLVVLLVVPENCVEATFRHYPIRFRQSLPCARGRRTSPEFFDDSGYYCLGIPTKLEAL